MSELLPESPTKLLRSGLDRLEIQSGALRLVISLASLKQGIVPFLNHQNIKLWYGRFKPSGFAKNFSGIRNDVIRKLQTLPSCLSSDWKSSNLEKYTLYQSVAFRMYMCRVAQTQNWSFPAVCQNGVWHNGLSRCFASGIKYEHPWLKLYGLEIIHRNQSSNLDDPILIDSDLKLHNVLNLNYNNQSIDSTIFLVLKEEQIVLQDLVGDFDNGDNPNGWNLWDRFDNWRSRQSTKPKIKIYTNWPEQIHNYFNAWSIVEIDSSQPLIDEIQGFGGRTGRLERFATEEHKNPKETVDYVLYVVNPRPIELGDLLIWMDMEHNVYIESEWKFLLYRKADVYKNTYINTSYIMQ